MMAWIVDTGPIVAFFDRRDALHLWAKKMWASAPLPLITCEPVLTEAAYILAEHAGLPPQKLLALLERNILQVKFDLSQHNTSVSRILEKYADLGIQLADASLIRMSELHKDCVVFTTDKNDFTVYRRFERQLIPIVAPDY